MKILTEKKSITASNAWGRDSTADHQDFEIEESDVGRSKDNYLGYRRSGPRFSHHDVGRIITVMSDGTGWTCWSFNA